MLYYDTVYIKAYDEVENNWLSTHTRILYATQGSYSITQRLSNKQSTKVMCVGLIDLEQHITRDKPYEHWNTYRTPTDLIT